MSTRAHVGILNNDKSCEIIFTHWDGYPSHHGNILLRNYKDTKSVRALMTAGNHECLESNPDKGDCWGDSDRFKTFDEMVKALRGSWAEYIYMWDVKHHRWMWGEVGSTIRLRSLSFGDCKR